jgi:two-component system, NtrC family, sensor histidine kinase KinB
MDQGPVKLWLASGGMGLLAAGAVIAARSGAPAWAWLLVVLVCVAGGVTAWVGIQSVNRWKMTAQEGHSAPPAQCLAQLQQARSQKAAQAVVDSLPHAVVMVSPEGHIEMVNEVGRTFGLELGQHVDAVPHTWFKKLVSAVTAAYEGGSARVASPVNTNERNGGDKEALVQMFSEGRELFFRPQATPLIDGQGQYLGAIIILMDVTAVRQVDEAKSSLLSSFSHELKTPMTSLQMSIYLLLDDAASRLTPRQLELLTAARDDADRLHRLVEEVLSAARKKL